MVAKHFGMAYVLLNSNVSKTRGNKKEEIRNPSDPCSRQRMLWASLRDIQV